MLRSKSFSLFLVLVASASFVMYGCGGDEDVTSLIDLQAPAVVKNVQAFPADQRVRVTWTANTDADLVGYNVYRSNSSSSGFTLIGSTGISQAPYFQDEGPDTNGDGIPDGLVNNIRYFYRVTAFDRDGRETLIDMSATVSAVPGSLPSGSADLEISNLRAYGGNERAIITWNLNLSNEVYGYKVYRNRLGASNGFELVAIVPQNVNYYGDLGLTNETDYVYQVAPITRDLLEGRVMESRPIRAQAGDATIPKPPGSDATNGPAVLLATTSAGVTLQWGRPTENTDGTLIISQATQDDLVNGGFVIFRADSRYGNYEPVGILENIGTESSYTYTDPQGTTEHFYTIRAYDATGNLSSPSAYLAANPAVIVPKAIRNVDAFASTSADSIIVTWTLETTASAGYRVYRSEQRDRGFTPLSGVLPPLVNSFTDTAGLELGRTYWYKVAGVATDSNGQPLEGGPSPAAPATPGPSDGVFYLEAENATVIAFSASTDWDALTRQAFPDPFNARGVLYIDPSATAVAGTSYVTLQWSMEIDAAGPAGPVRTYDVYLSTIRNSSAGIFDLFVQEPISGTSAINVNARDFHRSTFGFPPRPDLIYLGQLNFTDEDFVGGNPTNETINLRVGYQGFNTAIAAGNGELFLDGLVLIRR